MSRSIPGTTRRPVRPGCTDGTTTSCIAGRTATRGSLHQIRLDVPSKRIRRARLQLARTDRRIDDDGRHATAARDMCDEEAGLGVPLDAKPHRDLASDTRRLTRRQRLRIVGTARADHDEVRWDTRSHGVPLLQTNPYLPFRDIPAERRRAPRSTESRYEEFGSRSEERRVGKECRYRWSSDREIKRIG